MSRHFDNYIKSMTTTGQCNFIQSLHKRRKNYFCINNRSIMATFDLFVAFPRSVYGFVHLHINP